MKLRYIMAASLLAAFTAVPSVQADDEETQRQRPRRGRGGQAGQGFGPGGPPAQRGGMLGRIPLMVALDADKDGTISATEIENAAASLKKLDKNGDGKLTMDELRPTPGGEQPPTGPGAQPGGGRNMLVGLLERLDKNGDEKLSGDEIPERMAQRLDRLDTNGDQAIDKAELEAAAKAMGQRGGPGRNRPQPGQGDGSGVRPRRPGGNDK